MALLRARTACASAVCTAAVLVTAACSSGTADPQDDGRAQVVASFYPLQWLAEKLVGDHADITSLTPAGTEPHDLAVNADGLKALAAADVVLYLGADFQPDVQRAVRELDGTVRTADLLGAPGVTLLPAGDIGKETLTGGKDPHVWLSPVQMLAMADAAAAALVDGAPDLAETVEAALPTLRAELQALDTEYTTGLTRCTSTVLVTSHAAFGYLTHDYGLEQVPIAGVTPEAEPDPRTLESIAAVARARGVRTVFFEDALPSALSRTVADEIGARIDLLAALEFDPRGSLGPDQDYVSVMSGNLARIKEGLACVGS